MSATEVHSQSRGPAAGSVDMHLEVDIIPVSDVDRAKNFYQRLGWRLDGDDSPLPGLRIVQFTPPGSAASVTFGQGLTSAAPGSAEGGLIVSDIEAAHDELVGRGIDAREIWHGPPFPVEARQPGPDPERTSYGSGPGWRASGGYGGPCQIALASMPRSVSSLWAASMSETISPAWAEPGAAVVSPVPKVTEAAELGGVNWTMRRLGSGASSASSRQPRRW